ncbi:MAG: hypothetical protein JXR76_25715 [Deltaproteobacteria bacterium]|nr:hypothetical protein [Deltaproteobacteria bacterium]
MQQSIESFVRTLQEDGVAAGKAAGDKLLLVAESEAEEIIARANAKAAEILADARKQQEVEALRQTEELALAARDAVLELQHRLCNAVERMIDNSAAEVFRDHGMLATFIQQVAVTFAAKQAEKPNEAIVFRVAGDDAKDVVNKALTQLTVPSGDIAKPVFRVETGLLDLGFEYRQGGGGVEVTPGAVVSLLRPLLSEEVSKRVQEAVSQNRESASASDQT